VGCYSIGGHIARNQQKDSIVSLHTPTGNSLNYHAFEEIGIWCSKVGLGWFVTQGITEEEAAQARLLFSKSRPFAYAMLSGNAKGVDYLWSRYGKIINFINNQQGTPS